LLHFFSIKMKAVKSWEQFHERKEWSSIIEC
jgi:hypothetical protein